MWAPWSSRWAQRPLARSIRWTRSSPCESDTASEFTWMQPMAATSRSSPTPSPNPRARPMPAISQADSIVIDPHKHGLQPYGCGCVLFRDPAVGRFYKHDSPYTYFTSKQLHLGEISLECSRAGAAAVALWATQQLLPLVPDGEFARGLAARARRSPGTRPQIAWRRALPAARSRPAGARYRGLETECRNPGTSSQLAQEVFDACAARDLHLALVQLPLSWFSPAAANANQAESEMVTCLRSVLMKPEHEAWLDRIWERLSAACADTIRK